MRTLPRRALVTATIAVVAYLGSWLSAPFGTAPGAPLRMVGRDGTDLGVAALTISDGPDHRWLHLGDAALTKVPSRWLHLLRTHRGVDAQQEPRERGVGAAADLIGVHHLENPESANLGKVSGTSSGLAWALAALLLNDPALRGPGAVYATGTLYGNGAVGAIGGLEAKLRTPGLADASIVFVPSSQYATAVRSLRAAGNGDLVTRVFGVADLREALGVLCERTPAAPTCSFYRVQPRNTDAHAGSTDVKLSAP